MKNSKLIRRIQSFALAILLIFVILSATPAYASGVTEITFAAVETNVGDEVLVPVNIENNTGLAAFRFRVSYDTSALELLSVTKGSLLTSGTFESGTDADEKTLTFTWFNLCNVTGDGEIAVLRFKVSENAGGNYPLTVTYLPIDILNESYEQITCVVYDGKISAGCKVTGTVTSFGNASEPVTIKLLKDGAEINRVITADGNYSFDCVFSGSYVLEVSKLNHATETYEITVGRDNIVKPLRIHLIGDINGDGEVNGQDVVRLKKYLANYDYDTETSTVEINAGADANGDGVINGLDMVLLKKYLANYDYETNTSSVVLGSQN